MNELIMENSDKIITELSLCGYSVKEEVIPWIDHIHHRITVEDPFNEEHSLTLAENMEYARVRREEFIYISVSRMMLLRKLMREIMKREWPLERRAWGAEE